MNQKQAFGAALKKIRRKRGLTQEDFALVSSRTYVSLLERGEKSPTLDKITQITKELDINPGTLVILALAAQSGEDPADLLELIAKEIKALA